jgi:lycopene cyclase domain-containing protein
LKSNYLYLIINLLCILFPLLLSFHPKAPFYKKWKELAIAILISGVVFIVWDEIFTRLGIWGFNSRYITGWQMGSLPIEEIMFFIVIPYACVFTYFVLKDASQKNYFFSRHELLSYGLIVAMLITGVYNLEKAYTSVTLISFAFFLTYLTLKVRARYLGHFYVAFCFILLPFFIMNGVLTGSFIPEEIVWYNDTANLGIRLGTVPLEDIFYAMFLMLMNIAIYERVPSIKRNP